jgi:hypothetical protein
MNPLQALTQILNPANLLRIGVAENRYALVATDKQGNNRLISCGDNAPRFVPWVSPLSICTQLDGAPIRLSCHGLDGADPEQWIVRHEEKLIPGGFTSDQIVNEWSVYDGKIYSATVSKSVLEKSIARIERPRWILASLRIPLWDLARLYAASIPGPFIIWKITDKGSIFGYVRNGYLNRLLDSWVTVSERKKDQSLADKEIASLLRSLCQDEPAKRIIILVENPADVEGLTIPGYCIELPPAIKDLPAHYHEAYALACGLDSDLDFAAHEDQIRAFALEGSRKKAVSVARMCCIFLAALCMGLLLAGVVIKGVSNRQMARLAPVRAMADKLSGYQHSLDSMNSLLTQKARYLQRESAISAVLSDLQKVFPDGVYAEQISLSEISPGMWKFEVSAVSFSSALIPELLQNLNGIAGMSQARMAYSEYSTVKTPQGPKSAIRCKISAEWKM